MKTDLDRGWRTFRDGQNVFRWKTEYPWQNGTRIHHIIVGDWAHHYGPIGIPSVVGLGNRTKANVAMLIAHANMAALDAYRVEEANHEHFTDAYDAALVAEGGEL